jgi:hypothetical protein
MNSKYTIKRAFSETITGYEKVVWNVMDGEFIVDTFSLKRDAKYFMELWNCENERNSIFKETAK